MNDLGSQQQIGSGDLTCDCGGLQFIRVLSLKWHREGGTSEKPSGWKCLKCDKYSSTQEMIKKLQIKLKEDELNSLKGTIDEELKSLKT